MVRNLLLVRKFITGHVVLKASFYPVDSPAPRDPQQTCNTDLPYWPENESLQLAVERGVV